MSQAVTPGGIEMQPDTLRRIARKSLFRKNMRMFLLVNFGLLLVAAGIHFFKVPNGFATGGVSGLSIIISHLFPTVPVGPMMGIINVLLLGVGFASIGRKFGAMTVYSSFALSGMVWVMDLAIPLAAPLTGDRMLGLFAKGFLIDLVIESINTRKQLVIICSRPNEVSAFITETPA